MFGTFQQSSLRIEVNASEETLAKSLTQVKELQSWLWFERFSIGIADTLTPGTRLTGRVGLVTIQHEVELSEPNRIRFLLSQGIDGFHEWAWGDGWIQSRIEGVSLLPINLGQTATLLSLKQYLSGRSS
ncbi:hypothetical protein [Leptolyngbya sp. NIES-2104]|uniref:hypothetical protein n=1 Tax=Leptolyngbya sp. NIES-2104 TaxID=1552121 RepID=UPI0006ECA392|nr:hypothetical protein [Leptolyngbya sp. NIES-2104]GAP98264.1 hypothetical protein NIES2104_48180 [Leptolyngbya sp. NIES-2104]